jgi:hypothetical protein
VRGCGRLETGDVDTGVVDTGETGLVVCTGEVTGADVVVGAVLLGPGEVEVGALEAVPEAGNAVGTVDGVGSLA